MTYIFQIRHTAQLKKFYNTVGKFKKRQQQKRCIIVFKETMKGKDSGRVTAKKKSIENRRTLQTD